MMTAAIPTTDSSVRDGLGARQPFAEFFLLPPGFLIANLLYKILPTFSYFVQTSSPLSVTFPKLSM